MHAGCGVYYDLPRGRIRAVCYYPPEAPREVQLACKQHSSCTHGDAEQVHGHGSEALYGPVRPGEHVLSLVNAEADDVSAAGAVRPLVYDQHVEAFLQQVLRASAEILEGRAPVAVAAYHERRSLRGMIIPGVQPQPVEGVRVYVFAGPLAELVYQAADLVLERLGRMPRREIVVVLAELRRVIERKDENARSRRDAKDCQHYYDP